MTRLFVGNLSSEVTPDDLRSSFAAYGQVISADIVTDRANGESRGFGFIEMREARAMAAIQGLNGTTLKGQTVIVSRARPRSEGGTRGNTARGWGVAGEGRFRW